MAWGADRDFQGDFLVPVIAGNTFLFVFISGFLFQHVYVSNFTFMAFMAKKAKVVLLPYAIITALLLLLTLANGGMLATIEFGYGDPGFDPIRLYFTALVTGIPHTALWYIPFIAVVFLLSPVLIAYTKLSGRWQLVFLTLAIAAMPLVNRSSWNTNLTQNTLYFLPFYILGIYCCLRKSIFLEFSSKISVISCSLVAILLLGYLRMEAVGRPVITGILFEPSPNFPYLAANIFQKILMIFFFCGLFNRFPQLVCGPVRRIADNSFGLFFLHNVVLFFLAGHFGHNSIETGVPLLDLAIWFVIVLGLSMVLVDSVRRRAGRYSRMLIGS